MTETADNLEFGRWLFSQECTFICSAPEYETLPLEDLPEIAFAGRSNVGKSSLINALTSRQTLARTSNTPGRTQQLNFFNLAKRLMLVDMPGYGYAEASKKDISHWNRLIQDYLQERSTLQRVYLLSDSRHGLKPNDLEFMSWMDQIPLSYQIILTKADKLSATARLARIEEITTILKNHPAAYPEVLLTSAAKKQGIAELRASIAQFALPK